MPLSPGDRLGPYEILAPLGAGGMGEVYKARDARLDRIVAIKTSKTEFSNRFEREARAVAALNHSNICQIYDVGPNYLVMEFIEGKPLKGPLPVDQALKYAMQICDALDHAHAKGVTHRDLKPANILVTASSIKLLDFGLALLSRDGRQPAPTETTATNFMTKVGTVLGTAPYMSPEQAEAKPVDARSDIFSFGVVLYEMLSGRLPFSGDTAVAIMAAIVRDEPKPLDAPAEVARVVSRCLRKSSAERFQTAAELRAALEATPASKPQERTASSAGIPRETSTRQPTHAPRRQFRWAYLLAAVLILVVVGIFTWRALSPPQSIHSILILPLRPLSQEATDSLLGLGIADALITKVGQTGQLQVLPISAVRRYAKEDSDPLEAARHLNAETVLAGSLQQSGDRIRVSVQLLKTTTGKTIWVQSFDVRSGDVFTVQDEIARQVASQLSLKLDAGQRRDFEKRSTTNSQAFEFYSKSLYHLGNRMRGGEVSLAIELLKKAIEMDPNYALARAQLGYAYAVHGVFILDDPALVDLASKQLAEAEKLDPRIAQIHVARSVLLFSRHGQWNLRDAILEGRAALRLDPNAGHPDLAYYYDHLGLEALSAKHRYAALRSDPDNEYYKAGVVGHYYGFMLADEGAAAEQKLFHRSPSVEYYLIKGMVNEAAPLVEKEFAGSPGSSLRRNLEARARRAQLYALQENVAAAAAEIAAVEIEAEKAPRALPFHHTSYGIAQVRARMGDAPRALHWLQITVDTGWPQYPMMARDHMLDPVRNHPAVAKFLASLKKTWENNVREFGNEDEENHL